MLKEFYILKDHTNINLIELKIIVKKKVENNSSTCRLLQNLSKLYY